MYLAHARLSSGSLSQLGCLRGADVAPSPENEHDITAAASVVVRGNQQVGLEAPC